MSQFPQKLHRECSNLTAGNAVDDWRGTEISEKSNCRRAELFDLEGARMENATTEMSPVKDHAQRTDTARTHNASILAERLVREVRAEMRIEFEQAVSAAFDRLENATHDARRASVGKASNSNKENKPLLTQAVHPKTSAQMARGKDTDILYSVLSNEWQETTAVFRKAKHLGFRTGPSNCLWRLNKLVKEGFAELDRSHIRQRWRAV